LPQHVIETARFQGVMERHDALEAASVRAPVVLAVGAVGVAQTRAATVNQPQIPLRRGGGLLDGAHPDVSDTEGARIVRRVLLPPELDDSRIVQHRLEQRAQFLNGPLPDAVLGGTLDRKPGEGRVGGTCVRKVHGSSRSGSYVVGARTLARGRPSPATPTDSPGRRQHLGGTAGTARCAGQRRLGGVYAWAGPGTVG